MTDHLQRLNMWWLCILVDLDRQHREVLIRLGSVAATLAFSSTHRHHQRWPVSAVVSARQKAWERSLYISLIVPKTLFGAPVSEAVVVRSSQGPRLDGSLGRARPFTLAGQYRCKHHFRRAQACFLAFSHTFYEPPHARWCNSPLSQLPHLNFFEYSFFPRQLHFRKNLRLQPNGVNNLLG